MSRAPIFLLCLSACIASAPPSSAQNLTSAFTQPLRDLNILREERSEVLQRATAAPYAVPATLANGAANCTAIASEILALDIELGFDVDVSRSEETRSTMTRLHSEAMASASNAITDSIGDLVGLPYRNVIRRLTGAARRDREMREAVQYGMLRRAFLKGVRTRDCAEPERELAGLDGSPLQQVNGLEPVAAAAQEAQAEQGLQTVADVRPAG